MSFDEERKVNLKKLIKSLEYTKSYLMKEYNLLGFNDESVRMTTVYPMAKVKPLMINGYPVMQFAYDGVLPINDKDLAYLNKVKYYYYLATFDSYLYEKLPLPLFDKATIIFVHYFNYKQFSDLDNRNTKFIQDAIKLVGIIRDDNWENVWNVNMGYFDKERSHVQVYVVEQENMADFIRHLYQNHEKLKIPDSDIVKHDEYEEAIIAFQKEIQKKEEENRKINTFETINIIDSERENIRNVQNDNIDFNEEDYW